MISNTGITENSENNKFLRELPFYGINNAQYNSLFKNSTVESLPSKNDLERLTSLYDLDLFSLNTGAPQVRFTVEPFSQSIRCNYYSPHSFNKLKNASIKQSEAYSKFSVFHNNVRSLKRNPEKFQTHLLNELDYHFNVTGITETRINSSDCDFNPSMPGYNFEFVQTPLAAGGVGMYKDEELEYKILEKCANQAFQALWIEICQLSRLAGKLSVYNFTKSCHSGKLYPVSGITFLHMNRIKLFDSSKCFLASRDNFCPYEQALNLSPYFITNYTNYSINMLL